MTFFNHERSFEFVTNVSDLYECLIQRKSLPRTFISLRTANKTEFSIPFTFASQTLNWKSKLQRLHIKGAVLRRAENFHTTHSHSI